MCVCRLKKKNTVGIVILYLEIKKYDWSTLQIQGLKFLTSENIQIIVINTEGTYLDQRECGGEIFMFVKKAEEGFQSLGNLV